MENDKNDENAELKALMEALEAEADDEEICERCGVGIMVQRFGLQLCSEEGCSPFEGAPLDTRVLLRVSADDHKRWKYCAAVGRHSISAMIRGVVNRYVASPCRLRKLGAVQQRTGSPRPDIELRVSAAERELWARAAQEDGRSLTGMIRRAVMRHVWRMMDVLGYR